MIKKSSKPVSRKLLVSFLLILVTSNSGALHADDYVHMIQYELLFGNKQPVSNLYMSMRPVGMEQSFYGAGNQAMFRTPVISTDPHKLTLLKPLSVLFAMEESESSDDGEFGSDSEKTAGGHAGAIIGGLLLMAPLLYAISSAASDISDIDDIDLDLGEGHEIDIPEGAEVDTAEPPPEEGS
jgi:hypothetical protein